LRGDLTKNLKKQVVAIREQFVKRVEQEARERRETDN